jgi:hypothetical protein
MIGGGIKKESGHMMDLVTNKWYAAGGMESLLFKVCT